MPTDNVTPTIWSAARQGDIETLRALIADGSNAAHQRAADGCTALHYAAFGGSTEAVTLLLEAGSDPNAQASAGHTPLFYAAFAGQADTFQCLIQAGADRGVADETGTTLLHAAASGGSESVLETLLAGEVPAEQANIYGELPAHRAAQSNRLAAMQRLLSLGATANPTDRYGMTLLHKAAVGGACDTMSWLLDQGLDPTIGDIVGDTPLHSAATMGRLPLVELLLDREIDLSARNHEDATPLHNAAIAGHAEIVESLLNHGADATALNSLGQTPLHVAALRGNKDVVEALLSAADTSETKDVQDHRPIDLAALYGRTDTWNTLSLSQGNQDGELTPDSVKALVKRPVSRGEMVCWYLGHSGWAVRTQHHLFILDYAPGEAEREGASLINGRIDPSEWADVPVIVLTTHHHDDHFDRRILAWDHPKLVRVFGWNAPEDVGGFRLTRREIKRIGDVVVASIPATDAGSAFLVEADGVSFYHAGDHAAEQIPAEPAFTEGVSWLAEQFAPIQAAFLPVFGCGLPSPDTLQVGNTFTIDRLKPQAVFPMHIGWTGYFYRQFEQWAKETHPKTGLGIPLQHGDRFLVRENSIEQLWA